MNLADRLDDLNQEIRTNKWHWLFSIFCRVMLALGFIPSGLVKIMGERFTDLAVHHPMGHYLEALSYTGFYYPFIGVMQVTAAILLLIPRTATLGALLYFPIILNIFVLSMAVRFDGSLLTSPLMVLANLYLLAWDYHKLKWIFPFNHKKANEKLPLYRGLNNRFPFKFFSGVFITLLATGIIVTQVWELYPRNTYKACMTQCTGIADAEACQSFCICIHKEGKTLNTCLEEYHRATEQ